MRVVTFYIFLFFLLLGGGHNFYAGTHQSGNRHTSSQNFTKNRPIKSVTKDQISTVIEDTDIDSEEEHLGGDDLKEGNDAKLFAEKANWHYSCYLVLTDIFGINQYYQIFKTSQPNCGYSTPIYITQRVLRI
ncbi:hypothetical protein [Flavobacterium sp.]|uniref:hypothetical protein n=1 Tax=Flavobacterium sp. TaxID=239 RepID=UPI002FDA9F5C